MRVAVYSSAAEHDVKRALDYYKLEAGAKIANDLIDQIDFQVARILKNPEAFPIIKNNYRKVNLKRFPYQIIYRIADKNTVKIISVRHHKQHPDFGLDR